MEVPTEGGNMQCKPAARMKHTSATVTAGLGATSLGVQQLHMQGTLGTVHFSFVFRVDGHDLQLDS